MYVMQCGILFLGPYNLQEYFYTMWWGDVKNKNGRIWMEIVGMMVRTKIYTAACTKDVYTYYLL